MLTTNDKNLDIQAMYWFIQGNQCKLIDIHTKAYGKVYIAYMENEIIVYYFDGDHVIKHLVNSIRSQNLLRSWKPATIAKNSPSANILENTLLDMLKKDEWVKMPKGHQPR